jgi:NADH:ubiquinone oxidoreductase subunit 4 (subunit M)
MTMEFSGFPYLSAILLTCLAGLLVILFLPEERNKQIKWVSALFSGITLILSTYLFISYDKTLGGLQFVEKYAWVQSLGITYFNAADGFNLPMLLLTGIVFFTGVLTMWELHTRVKEFYALYFLLVTGVFGLFMSFDLFFIFIWYDVSLFPMYLLIVVWGTTRKEYGAMKLTLYLLAGSALILPAIIYLFVNSGICIYFSLPGFRHTGCDLAVSYLVTGRPCGRPPCGEHGSCRRADEDRRIRCAACRHLLVPGRMAVLGPAYGPAGYHRHCLWDLCRLKPNGS